MGAYSSQGMEDIDTLDAATGTWSTPQPEATDAFYALMANGGA
jgi:hypothetical protein